MTTFAVTPVSSLFCQASTRLRIGWKFRCIRSTPTEMQSMSGNDFECFDEYWRERVWNNVTNWSRRPVADVK
jgi:hypothetical protein